MGHGFDVTELPVPVDLLVCTEAEWEGKSSQGRGLRPVVWIDESGAESGAVPGLG